MNPQSKPHCSGSTNYEQHHPHAETSRAQRPQLHNEGHCSGSPTKVTSKITHEALNRTFLVHSETKLVIVELWLLHRLFLLEPRLGRVSHTAPSLVVEDATHDAAC